MTLEQLHANVLACAEQLKKATERTSAARGEECNATNAYNNACKEFDKAVESLKTTAPQNTDWSNAKLRRNPVEQPRNG